MDSPGWGDFLGTAIYVIVIILLAAAQAIAIVVIAYGFIATAVCVLVGPDLRAVLHRSEAGVALLGLVSMLPPIRLLPSHRGGGRFHHRQSHRRSLRLPPAGTLSTVQLIAWFPVLFITFLASIYVLLKVPRSRITFSAAPRAALPRASRSARCRGAAIAREF